MDIISSIKQVFSRPANASAEMDRLVRFAKSKQGIKLTAQLMQQTDSLTKKDIAVWRQAWQAAISVETPNRARLYDVYTDCTVDLHLTGCIGQRKGKTLQKEFRLVGKDGKENEAATVLLKKEWFFDFMDLALDSRFGDTASYSWGILYATWTVCASTVWSSYRANTYALSMV